MNASSTVRFTALAISGGTVLLIVAKARAVRFDLIITTGVIVALAFYLFAAQCDDQNPFISLGNLKDRNYVLGLLFMFLLGVLVLSMNVIMPLFLQNARGYPILTAALVMMPRG